MPASEDSEGNSPHSQMEHRLHEMIGSQWDDPKLRWRYYIDLLRGT